MIHRRFRGQCFRGTIDDEIQEKEVVLQFRQMSFRYGDGSFRAISDVKKALQAFGDGFNVDRVQNIGTKRSIPFFSEVATSDAEIVRREIPFDDGDEKVVVQLFDETVDGVCEKWLRNLALSYEYSVLFTSLLSRTYNKKHVPSTIVTKNDIVSFLETFFEPLKKRLDDEGKQN